MRKILYANYCLLILCLSIVGFFAFLFLQTTPPSFSLQAEAREYKFVDYKFHNPKCALIAYSKSPLALQETPYKLTLPDLRSELIYYGRNLRPDVTAGRTLYFIGLEGTDALAAIGEAEPLYLQYHPPEELGGKSHYSFSPHNHPTALWMELQIGGTHPEAVLSLIDENQRKIDQGSECAHFKMVARTMRAAHEWQLGKHRVDSTLLIKQKARFVGEDLFLQMHGGSDFAHIEGASRIDFLDGPLPYSCFVRVGDLLIWDQERWQIAGDVKESAGKPLLLITSMEERFMGCELWDEIGSKKIPLQVVRIKDQYGLPDVPADFHFIQAKTWSQYLVECRGKKMTLRPNDWLLLTAEGWEKIDTVEKVDQFVDQTLSGPLLVVGKLKKEEGGQVLTAHLFNSTRSEAFPIKLEPRKTETTPVIQALRAQRSHLSQDTHSIRDTYYEKN